MKLNTIVRRVLFSAILACSLVQAHADSHGNSTVTVLKDGWALKSSTDSELAGLTGAELATVGLSTASWLSTTVPNTVLGSFVQAGRYPEPFFGMNLLQIPGMNYPVGSNFAKLPMPDGSPFRNSWWYRTEFSISREQAGHRIWLGFKAINYRANIWVNGKKLADKDQVVGAYRAFEFDVTDYLEPSGKNALAVEVFASNPDDLGITWVDWNPAPADKNMGLWREVYLKSSPGPVTIFYPQVSSHFHGPDLSLAELAVHAVLRNSSHEAVQGTLQGEVEGLRFSKAILLAANESREVTIDSKDTPLLKLRHPRVWWPASMGRQEFYQLGLRFVTMRRSTPSGTVSDAISTPFAIREVTASLIGDEGRLFHINGKPFFVRGGGWAPDLFLRSSPERQEKELKYVLDLGLNTVRLEGKIEDEHFFNLADHLGIMVMSGWCCCDQWELWPKWKAEDHGVSEESLRTQVRSLRNHPSALTWLYGSDNPPPPPVEQKYIQVLNEEFWPNPYQSSASGKAAPVTGKSGFKMSGPYDWVPPNYWMTDDHDYGGAFGFNSETSPGPAIPPIESLKRMIPADHLWPIDEYWGFHGGGTAFKNSAVFTQALNARYGTSNSVDEYAMKAQVQAYESHRAMFEAYLRNKYVRTGGIIQWMLNNAWPSTIWHLYDYFLRPGGSYFGAKKANEPVHILYSYDDQTVAVVNNLMTPQPKLEARARVLNFDLSVKWEGHAEVSLDADSSLRAFQIPKLDGLSSIYFVKLTLTDERKREVSNNFYWLSTQPDVLDWKKSDWKFTPVSTYADFTGLASLPMVKLQAEILRHRRLAHSTVDDEQFLVRVYNPSKALAFSVRLKLGRLSDDEEILPVLWSDNYISLLPGETRALTVTVSSKDRDNAPLGLSVSGWNVLPQNTR